MLEPEDPQVSLSLFHHGLDLDATLTSGQAFSWKRTADGRWRGWIDRRPCLVWSQGDALRAVGPGLTREAVTAYFNLGLPIQEIFASFPEDAWLAKARAFAPGLRILRQEPWETLCNFICSSLKQIVQIEQINHELRRVFGDEIGEGLHSFPDSSRLALATEANLRACRLGFRARHLFVAAQQVASSEVSLQRIATLPTAEARGATDAHLRGVGPKKSPTASCSSPMAARRFSPSTSGWIACCAASISTTASGSSTNGCAPSRNRISVRTGATRSSFFSTGFARIPRRCLRKSARARARGIKKQLRITECQILNAIWERDCRGSHRPKSQVNRRRNGISVGFLFFYFCIRPCSRGRYLMPRKVIIRSARYSLSFGLFVLSH